MKTAPRTVPVARSPACRNTDVPLFAAFGNRIEIHRAWSDAPEMVQSAVHFPGEVIAIKNVASVFGVSPGTRDDDVNTV